MPHSTVPLLSCQKLFGHTLDQCPKFLVTLCSSVQTFWSHFVKVPKFFGHILDKWLDFGYFLDKCPNFLVTFWTSTKLFGHILDICPSWGHILVTLWTSVQILATFWSHFGHILDAFSKMCLYSHRSPAPKRAHFWIFEHILKILVNLTNKPLVFKRFKRTHMAIDHWAYQTYYSR